jgi:hypothetical protein
LKFKIILRKTEGTLKKILGLIEKPGFTKAKKYRLCTVKPVHKGHSREPENVAFMSSCLLYTG